jgi:hypothetical protein
MYETRETGERRAGWGLDGRRQAGEVERVSALGGVPPGMPTARCTEFRGLILAVVIGMRAHDTSGDRDAPPSAARGAPSAACTPRAHRRDVAREVTRIVFFGFS